MGQAVEPPNLGRWHRLARAVAPPLYTDKRWNRLSGAVAPPLYTDRRYCPCTSVNRLTQAVAPPLTP
ncbi:unnamed protein product, partial [Musa textilis]